MVFRVRWTTTVARGALLATLTLLGCGRTGSSAADAGTENALETTDGQETERESSGDNSFETENAEHSLDVTGADNDDPTEAAGTDLDTSTASTGTASDTTTPGDLAERGEQSDAREDPVSPVGDEPAEPVTPTPVAQPSNESAGPDAGATTASEGPESPGDPAAGIDASVPGPRPPFGGPRPPSCSERTVFPSTAMSIVASCHEQGEDEFNCDCGAEDSVPVTLNAANCSSALESSCGIEDTEGAHCAAESLGACIETSEGQYECVCRQSLGNWTQATADSCNAALDEACGHSCSSEFGNCTTSVTSGAFDCECEIYGPREAPGALNCDQAVEYACDPSFGIEGTGPCNGVNSYCQTNGVGNWVCTCLDGVNLIFVAESLSTDALLGEHAEGLELSCAVLTGLTCGSADGEGYCERETGAHCEPAEGRFTTFACTCETECDGSSTHTQVAPSCEDAMIYACGEGPGCP